jgi:hypothetical protein
MLQHETSPIQPPVEGVHQHPLEVALTVRRKAELVGQAMADDLQLVLRRPVVMVPRTASRHGDEEWLHACVLCH